MKTSVMNRNGINPEIAGLITRLVTLIPWPVEYSGESVPPIPGESVPGIPRYNVPPIPGQSVPPF